MISVALSIVVKASVLLGARRRSCKPSCSGERRPRRGIWCGRLRVVGVLLLPIVSLVAAGVGGRECRRRDAGP